MGRQTVGRPKASTVKLALTDQNATAAAKRRCTCKSIRDERPRGPGVLRIHKMERINAKPDQVCTTAESQASFWPPLPAYPVDTQASVFQCVVHVDLLLTIISCLPWPAASRESLFLDNKLFGLCLLKGETDSSPRWNSQCCMLRSCKLLCTVSGDLAIAP